MSQSNLTFKRELTNRVKSVELLTCNSSKFIDKKPKDLLRAIGKIEQSDWNIREIEKKIEQSKKGSEIIRNREKVPKWNREQFVARQNQLTNLDVQENKYKEFDDVLKTVEKKLKEGAVLENAKNKVANISNQFKQKQPVEKKTNHKSSSKPFAVTKDTFKEKCYFCKQNVYLMEKMYAEHLVFHRSCFKCYHCNVLLRLGSYAFDKDDKEGKFYCNHHFRLPPLQIQSHQNYSAEKSLLNTIKNHNLKRDNIVKVSETLVIPGNTNIKNAEIHSDEESLESQVDDVDWTSTNFLTCSDSSEDSQSSDFIKTPSDNTTSHKQKKSGLNWRKKYTYKSEEDFGEYSSDGK